MIVEFPSRLDYSSPNFKALIFQLNELRTDELGEIVVHCPNLHDIKAALMKYRESNVIIMCHSKHLVGLDKLLLNCQIDKLYVLYENNNQDMTEWLDGLILNTMTKVHSKKQLMRHLCMATMLWYYRRGEEHQQNGDYGLANLYFQDSRSALAYAAEFI